jgi:hypothetical protein
LLAGLLPLLLVYLVLFNPIRLINHVDQGVFTPFYYITVILMLVLLILMGYAIVRITIKIRKLESQSKE